MNRSFIVVIFVLLSHLGWAQELSLSADFSGNLTSFVEKIEEENKVKILTKKQWTNRISIEYQNERNLKSFLTSIIQQNDLSIVYRDQFIVILPSNPLLYVSNEELEAAFGEDLIVIGESAQEESSVEFVISVINGANDERLIGASVYIDEISRGGVTDQNGNLTLSIKPGIYTLSTTYVGYERTRTNVFVRGDGSYTQKLFEDSRELEEVQIETDASSNVTGTSLGVISLSPDLVKKLPSFYGEADVIKSLTLLPGVSTAGEGSQGFTVRGGNTDQNLLLFDGATIYNASHLFGFFSNINTEFIGSATLFKSTIPSRYGGRASSVLVVNSREPSMKDFKLEGGIGIASSKVFTEIPVIEDQTSILLAGRVSYINHLLRNQNNIQVFNSRGNFNDLNVKVVQRAGENGKLTFSGYRSFDEFKFEADTTYGWITETGSVTWDQIISSKLSVRAIGALSDYKFNITGQVNPFDYNLQSGIGNKSGSLQLFYDPGPNIKLEAGGEYKDLTLNPGEFTSVGSDFPELALAQKEYADLTSVFGQAEFLINDQLSMEAGLRFNNYRYLGPRAVNLYSPDSPRNSENVIGSQTFGDGEVIQAYSNLEPRVSIRLTIDELSSLKASYNRNHQYFHSLSTNTSITPIEVWKASDQFLAPLRNDQYSIGYFRNLRASMFEASVELYYRSLDNVIDYKNASRILLNPNMEQAIVIGNGEGYGSEFYLRKTSGRLIGWLSYTYSRTRKQINGASEEETVNEGNWYPSEYDRPHNLSVAGTYHFNRRISVGGNFVFSTGVPFTGPEVRYVTNGTFVTHFANRHQYRIPDYHRLDISLTIDESLRKDRKLKGSWTLSVFNLYGRRNAYSVFIGQRNTSSPVAYQLSVLGRWFPSITYNLRID